jgi:hypothetical protein
MHELSKLRVMMLRAGFLIIFVGLATQIWPLLVNPPLTLPLMNGVVRSLLTSLSLLAGLGVRFPVKMLPLLLFEILWKAIWIVVFGLPQWRSGHMSAETGQTMFECLLVIPYVFVIPWGYVWNHFVRASADRGYPPARA